MATTQVVQDFHFNTFLTVKHWVILGTLGCLAVTVVVTLIRQASSADRTAADHP